MFKRIKQFFEDVRAEFKRVSWPTREATLKSTTIVLVLSTVIAIFLGAVDLGLVNAMRLILGN